MENVQRNKALQGWWHSTVTLKGQAVPGRRGGDAMEVYQTLTLMISFATLVVLVLSFHKRK
ncbi:putative holin-like toxin [Paenibacillus silviterrae]